MQKHLCLSCGRPVSETFCGNCGEKRITADDQTVHSLIHHFLHDLTNIDGKFIHTINTLFIYPGRLSEDYVRGKRRPYLKPVSLFLVLTAVYFIFSPFALIVAPLKTHTQATSYREYASTRAAEVQTRLQMSNENFETIFYQTSKSTARWLIFSNIPLFTILLIGFQFPKRRRLYDHVVMTFELNSFNLASNFILMPLMILIVTVVMHAFGISMQINDAVIMPLFSLILILFFSRAMSRFYMESRLASILKSIGMLFLYLTITMIGYRFILFELTLWAIEH